MLSPAIFNRASSEDNHVPLWQSLLRGKTYTSTVIFELLIGSGHSILWWIVGVNKWENGKGKMDKIGAREREVMCV